MEVDLEGGRNLYTYLKIYQLYTSNFLKKSEWKGGEMTQQLRALASPAEVPCSVPRTHMAA